MIGRNKPIGNSTVLDAQSAVIVDAMRQAGMLPLRTLASRACAE